MKIGGILKDKAVAHITLSMVGAQAADLDKRSTKENNDCQGLCYASTLDNVKWRLPKSQTKSRQKLLKLKKTMKKIKIALFAFLMAALMTGCFESKDSATADLASQVAGEYNFFSLTAGGKTYNVTEYLALTGGETSVFVISKIDASNVKMEIYNVKNGVRKIEDTVTVKLTDLGGGSIKLDDPNTPTVDGTITYKDGSITFADKAGVIVYKKK